MGSVIDYLKCPQCGGVVYNEVFYKRGEELEYCMHCGKWAEIKRPATDEERAQLPEGENFLKEEGGGFGRCSIASTNGVSRAFSLDKPYNEEIEKWYTETMKNEDVDAENSYLTRWDAETQQIITVHGRAPKLYDDFMSDENENRITGTYEARFVVVCAVPNASRFFDETHSHFNEENARNELTAFITDGIAKSDTIRYEGYPNGGKPHYDEETDEYVALLNASYTAYVSGNSENECLEKAEKKLRSAIGDTFEILDRTVHWKSRLQKKYICVMPANYVVKDVSSKLGKEPKDITQQDVRDLFDALELNSGDYTIDGYFLAPVYDEKTDKAAAMYYAKITVVSTGADEETCDSWEENELYDFDTGDYNVHVGRRIDYFDPNDADAPCCEYWHEELWEEC